MKYDEFIHTISYDIHGDYVITHIDVIVTLKAIKPWILYSWEVREEIYG